MDKLLLYPSVLSQWHALVHEATDVAHVNFCEEIESYLVFLLMRFANQANLEEASLGVDYLASFHLSGAQRTQALRELGDKCLLLAGLFPKQAEARLVNMGYFVKLGQGAYARAGDLQAKSGALFVMLSREFVRLMDVLLALRVAAGTLHLSPLELESLWQETRSQTAKEQLTKLATSQTPILGALLPKSIH